MPSAAVNDPLLAWMLPVYFGALALEAWYSHSKRLGWYEGRDTLASLAMLLAAGIVELLPKLVAIWAMLAIYAISPFADIIGRGWWAWILLFLLDDFSYYLFHRSNHGIRLLWAGHVNHHSSEQLNFSTALRQGVGERLHKYLYWLWLPLLGFDIPMILTMMSLSLFYQFWIHTPTINRLPRVFEWVLNTPSHHRVHHASNPLYIDRNHGGTLIVWDRLFGTFQAELASEPPVYGLTKNLVAPNPWTVLTHEYRSIAQDLWRAPTWGDRWYYLFGPPGWSHDQSDLSARALRGRALLDRHD